MSEPLHEDCIHCRDRLSALERVTVSHEARLMAQAHAIESLEGKLDRLGASNGRIEALLERVLRLVTPSARGDTDPGFDPSKAR